METKLRMKFEPLQNFRKYLTYKEWKQKHVYKSINSKMPRICKYLTYKEWKLSSSSSSWSAFFRRKCRRKYLTYKEWKLVVLARPCFVLYANCKYLTYKEWKPFAVSLEGCIVFCKYLTYKE